MIRRKIKKEESKEETGRAYAKAKVPRLLFPDSVPGSIFTVKP